MIADISVNPGASPGRLDKPAERLYCGTAGRGTQVVRERSAKPLYVSSILTRASSRSLHLTDPAKPSWIPGLADDGTGRVSLVHAEHGEGLSWQ